jgi:hypothetical protein
MSEPTFPFSVVEDYVLRRHPDPDGTRQECAAAQGAKVSAPWMAIVLGVDRKKILAWRTRGVRLYEADEIAVSLGLHPTALFDDWANVIDDGDEPDPSDWFRQVRANAYNESVRLRSVAWSA